MANIKISDLTAAAAASGTQEFEVNDSLTSKKVTGAQVLSYVQANTTPASIGAVSTADTIAVAKGGTGATTAPDARTNLGLVIGTDVLSPSGSGASLTALNASNISTGTVGTARLATGTANSTTFLRGDQTWTSVSGNIGTQGQVFTSSGTFTVPSGITAVKVTVIGGGGNGGTVTGTGSFGGGGGGGGVAIKYVTGLTPAGTVTVTVGGAAGTSSFGAHCSATGGATAATVTSNAASGAGGAGGAGSSGDINISGSAGSAADGAVVVTGNGGGSSGSQVIPAGDNTVGLTGTGFIGGSGGQSRRNTDGVGNAAVGFGNGGGGAYAGGATDRAGGAGVGGVVIVEY